MLLKMNEILTFLMLAHSGLQRAVVDDDFGRGDAWRARRLACAAVACLPTCHLLGA